MLGRDALIWVCTNTRSLCVCEAGDYQKGGTTNRSEIDRPHGSFLLHLYSRANHVPFHGSHLIRPTYNQKFVQCSVQCSNHLGRYVDRGRLFLRNPNFQLIVDAPRCSRSSLRPPWSSREGPPRRANRITHVWVTLPIAHGMMLAIIGRRRGGEDDGLPCAAEPTTGS